VQVGERKKQCPFIAHAGARGGGENSWASINTQLDFARTSQLFELNLSIVALLDFPVQIFTQFLHLCLCVVCVCVLSTAHIADICLIQEFDPVFVV
jgi:hypothetical protein